MRTLGLMVFSSICLFNNCEENGRQSCVESCKEGEQERLGEHCYYWSTKRVHWPPQVEYWDYAKLECESMNGSLAAVTSMKIHNFLTKDDRNTRYWIGGSDREKEGTWKWEDGSEWDFTNWASRPIRQPSGGDNHDCLQIYDKTATNGWNDGSCNKHNPFICSWTICPGHICRSRVVREIFIIYSNAYLRS